MKFWKFFDELNYENFAEDMKTNKENVILLNVIRLESYYKYAGEKIIKAYNEMKKSTSYKIYPVKIEYKKSVGYYTVALQESKKAL